MVTREHGEARLTKWLGDGFMLAPDRPGVHASVHHGHAIPREGDDFGSVINFTARLLGVAGATS